MRSTKKCFLANKGKKKKKKKTKQQQFDIAH